MAETWDGYCLTCKHWDGPTKQILEKIKEFGDIVMDEERGWATDSDCKIDYLWSAIEINGDASATLTVSGNHGCRRWLRSIEEEK